MLLIDDPNEAPGEADALIEEARRRTRRRRGRIALTVLLAAAGVSYLLAGSGGGGGGGPASVRGGGTPGASGGQRSGGRSVGGARAVTTLPDISAFGLLAPGEGWAANGIAFYFTTDDGAHWSALRIPRLTTGDVVANLSASASVGRWEVFLSYPTGETYGSCAHPTDGGPGRSLYTIYSMARLTNSGRSVALSTVPGCRAPISLSFVDATTGFALALGAQRPYAPSLLVTRDAGRTWRVVAAAPFTGAIRFATANNGWGVNGPAGSSVPRRTTRGGDLYRTTDGGRSWRRMSLCGASATTGTVTACGLPRFFGPRFGVLAAAVYPRHGGSGRLTVYRTYDGGRNWTSARLPRAAARDGARPQSEFVAVSPTRWIALVAGRLYATFDAGARWNSYAPTPAFPKSVYLDFVTPRDGWLVSLAGFPNVSFDHTTDGGRDWEPLAKG